MRTGLLVTAGWLGAAAAATAVSWSAVTLATSAVPAAKPLSRAAAQPGVDTPGATGTGTPSPQPATHRGTGSGHPTQTGPTGHATSTPVRASGVGGWVTFRCAGSTRVYLNVSPQLGYSSHTDDSGSGEVRFESSTHRTDITMSCVAGTPHWQAAERDTGGGGGGGGGDGGGGGGGGGGSGGSGNSGKGSSGSSGSDN